MLTVFQTLSRDGDDALDVYVAYEHSPLSTSLIWTQAELLPAGRNLPMSTLTLMPGKS